MDKIAKKLKLFLDASQKYKYRLAALLAFLESSPEAEQARAYNEYPEQLVTFVLESYHVTLERLSVEREFQAKFEKGLAKDLDEHFKVPLLFERVLRYLRGELPAMAQSDQLLHIVRSLLHPLNHPVLRKAGLRLLLLWLKDESAVIPDTLPLFASCIPLALFVAEGQQVNLDQIQFPLAAENEPPIFAAPSGVSAREQASALFNEILLFITFDHDADRNSTLFLYRLLRQYYLTKLYPDACVRGGILDKDQSAKTEGFVDGCPPSLQAVMVKYFTMWTVQSAELFSSASAPSSSSSPPSTTLIPVAAFILQEILLNSPEDLELIHEIIRQTLLLPFSHKPSIKIALNILRTWVFNAEERRPVFLQGVPTSKTTIALLQSASVAPDQVLDYYLQRYMGLLALLFNGRPAMGYGKEQAELYREGVFFLRGLSMKAFFPLSRDSWNQLINVLLDITENHLAGEEKYTIISDSEAAEEFSQLLAETLLGVWIRSETTVQTHWQRLAEVLGQCTLWSPVVAEWSRTLAELTSLMAEIVFAGKNLPAGEAIEATGRKRQLRNGTFEGQNLAALVAAQSPIGRAMSCEVQGIPQNAPKLQPSSSIDRRSDNFLAWQDLAWTKDNVIFLWRNMLRALGDINNIEKPEIHDAALQCLVQVFNRLLALRDSQPYFYRPLPPLFEFALTLLDACDLPPKAYERSRCSAYSAICRMFCRRHDLSFPDEYYTRFYLAIINGLSDKDDSVAAVILLNTSHIFGRHLPGSHILIPAYLKSIAGMLNSQIVAEKSGVLVPMMRIACNIAILPDVYDKITVPRIEAPLPIMSAIPITCAGEMELDGIKMQIKDFLSMMDCQEFTRNDPPVHSVLLSVVGILLFNELLAQSQPNETLIDGYLNVMLDHLLPKDSAVMPIVFDEFYASAQLLPLFSKFGQEREVLVIQRLVAAIRSAFADVESPSVVQDELVAKLIFTMLEWLMALPYDWLFKYQSLREQVFAVLEESLARASPNSSMGKSHGTLLSSSPQKSSDRMPHLSTSLAGSKDESGSGNAGEQEEIFYTREAAEFALVHLMHHLGNFSPEFGPTFTNSKVPEPMWHAGLSGETPDRVLYFAFDDSAILAVQQLGSVQSVGSGEPQVRIIIRNAAGRFSWDAHAFFETFEHRASSLFAPEDVQNWQNFGRLRNLILTSAKAVSKVEPYHAVSGGLVAGQPEVQSKQIPRLNEHINLEHTDMLRSLLDYISQEHPECINSERAKLAEPDAVPVNRIAAVKQVAKYCQEQIKTEDTVAVRYAEISATGVEGLGEDGVHHVERHERAAPARAAIGALSPYQFSRQFLASFGFLTPVMGATGEENKVNLKVLAKTSGMLRDLKGLDKRFSREVVKVAVLYVAPGQEEECVILKNSAGSDAYAEFIRSLGWSVDLKEHVGYTGGLECGMTRGDQALYYCSSSVECVFHEATQILLEDLDTKLIGKKRHIGNDYVHIVWNEHHRDYRPTVIRGDYGNAQIVITPSASHLYRVNIFRDVSVPLFGPLFDGALIPRALLGPLVRATAICAHRAVLTSLGKVPLRHPMSHRARDLALIVKRHAQQRWTLEQFISYSMFANNPLPEELRKDPPPLSPIIPTSTTEVNEVTEIVENLKIDTTM